MYGNTTNTSTLYTTHIVLCTDHTDVQCVLTSQVRTVTRLRTVSAGVLIFSC